MRIGIHTSIAGALENAASKAARLGANTFQIFSASPRMWRVRPLRAEEVYRLREVREQFDLTPMVVHDNYLINLAASSKVLRIKSVAAFRNEIERTLAIGAEYLVAHPGSYAGHTLEQGILVLARSLAEASAGIRADHLTLLLENTAGSGSAIGSRFEELAEIQRLASAVMDFEIGYCLDTAHCLAAGYDVATEKGFRETMKAAQDILRLDRVKVIHVNDSKSPLGSRVDRHEHIGKGHIGREGFRRILNHAKLRKKPFILETPVENEGDDRKNIRTLKQLCRKSRTTTN